MRAKDRAAPSQLLGGRGPVVDLAVVRDPDVANVVRHRLVGLGPRIHDREPRGRERVEDVIGCGTEPALHKGFSGIARLAKEYKIPFVGFTSNGQLLKEDDIEGFIECKLDELTLFDIDEVTRYNAGWWGNHAAKYDVIS